MKRALCALRAAIPVALGIAACADSDPPPPNNDVAKSAVTTGSTTSFELPPSTGHVLGAFGPVARCDKPSPQDVERVRSEISRKITQVTPAQGSPETPGLTAMSLGCKTAEGAFLVVVSLEPGPRDALFRATATGVLEVSSPADPRSLDVASAGDLDGDGVAEVLLRYETPAPQERARTVTWYLAGPAWDKAIWQVDQRVSFEGGAWRETPEIEPRHTEAGDVLLVGGALHVVRGAALVPRIPPP